MYLRVVFILLLAPATVFAGTEATLPDGVKQSLARALATNDAFVIDATFAAATKKHPAYEKDILALKPSTPQEEQAPQKPAAFTPKVVAQSPAKSAPEETENADWSGDITAAFDKETGNTETETLMMAYQVERESGNWRHRSSGRARFASEDDQTINEDYRFKLGSDWKFSERLFVFGEGEYITDEFSGFDYRVSESVGLGSRWKWGGSKPGTGKSYFDLRASVGGRHLKEVNAANAEHNAIFKPAAELNWHISDLLTFGQKADTTIGTDVTITESETSLNYALNSRLAIKLAFQLEHTSSVPAGTQKTETYTSTGITYKLFDK